LLQVLQPQFDPQFSSSSYGFRPGRSALQAVAAAKRYVEEGRTWVVDVDLEKFFDRVNHDVLMGKLETRIADRRVLRLIRSYLVAGILADGVVVTRHEGTPQGGPLSPLLANVLLDEVDKELERRGHRFARYADDCNVYVRSKRAAERVMATLQNAYGSLRLRINESKSAVAEVWGRKFLSYAIVRDENGVHLTIAEKAQQKLKGRVRELTRGTIGQSLERVIEQLTPLLRGWRNYFRLVEVEWALKRLDSWLRHRLRALLLKQWKKPRTVFKRLRALGVPAHVARPIAQHVQRRWWTSGKLMNGAVPNRFFDERGLPRLAA
jgi:group II intron reverse transcriptase/maturase